MKPNCWYCYCVVITGTKAQRLNNFIMWLRVTPVWAGSSLPRCIMQSYHWSNPYFWIVSQTGPHKSSLGWWIPWYTNAGRLAGVMGAQSDLRGSGSLGFLRDNTWKHRGVRGCEKKPGRFIVTLKSSILVCQSCGGRISKTRWSIGNRDLFFLV